jgi:hypothetical protein
MIIRFWSGQYLRVLIQRWVSILQSYNTFQAYFVQILAVTTAHNACVTGDLSTAEELLTQDIHTNANYNMRIAHLLWPENTTGTTPLMMQSR